MASYVSCGVLMCLLITPLALAQQKKRGATPPNRIVLGRLANGAAVTFVRAGSGDWGLEISGAGVPRLSQQKPAPLFALSFRDGKWAAVLDLAPRGNTTQEETTSSAATPVIELFSSALWARAKFSKAESSSAFGCRAQRTTSRAPLGVAEALRRMPLCDAGIIPSKRACRRVTRWGSGSGKERLSAVWNATPGAGLGRH